jgi:hypothetical protein
MGTQTFLNLNSLEEVIMPFWKRVDPQLQALSDLVLSAASRNTKQISAQEATVLAKAILEKQYSEPVAKLGKFVLVPVAFCFIKNWEGCWNGCIQFSTFASNYFGISSLEPINILLRGVYDQIKPHDKQAVEQEFASPQGTEFVYLLHMLFETGSFLLYRQYDPIYRGYGEKKLTFHERELLEETLDLANCFGRYNLGEFVIREVDRFKEHVNKILHK